MANYADKIHEALSNAAATFAFPKVGYTPRAGGAGYVRTTSMSTTAPSTVLVDAEGSGFVQAELQRRARGKADQRERSDWTWIMDLAFNGPVSLEEFEATLMESPPRVLRDPASGLDQQVTLELAEAAYEVPPRQQPASGTKVRYRFIAVLTPF